MKTKIVQYIGRMKDAGAETLVKDYALLLDKEEFDVIVLCENVEKQSANYKTLIDSNVKVITTYGNLDYLYRILSRIFGSKIRSLLLRKKLKDIKPDVIHIHLEQLEDIYNVRDLLNGVKLFYTCHNLPNRMIGSEKPKERKACEYLLKHNNLQIIALHEQMKDEINQMFQIDNTIVLKNGINLNKFRTVDESKEEIRESLGIEKDAFVIGHVGRFMYQKNHEFLIKIFNEVTIRNSKAKLVLVGTGKLYEDVLNEVKNLNLTDKVIFLKNRSDINRILKALDVYLFPSRWEGLSVSLIEAQASGLPCIVSNTINKETYQTNQIVELDLNDDVSLWAEACLNPICNITSFGNIEDFDMNRVIKELENKYKI